MRRKLFIISPAPISSTSARPICAVTSAPRSRCFAIPSEPPRVDSLSAAERSILEVCSAGTSPKNSPVAIETSAVNPRTRPLTDTSGREPAGRLAMIAFKPPQAKIPPSTPPKIASSTLSVSSCRTIRPRPAPSEDRTAISVRREAARASSNPATLAQAISSTNPTAPCSTVSGCLSP